MNRALKISTANILYLVSILLVVIIGSLIQVLNLIWGLIATEIFLILIPTLLFLRMRNVPVRDGLRLRPLGIFAALLSVILGASIWFFDAWIDTLIMQISGLPPVQLASGSLPDTALEGVLFFVAFALAAPIGEEALFRGAIQGAYERWRGPVFAIVMSSLMFAFYHFRLTGLPALLPVSFLLGYVVWRSQSLYAGMLVHFGNNAMSAIFSLLSLFYPDVTLPQISVLTALVGLAIAIVGLFLFMRLVPVPEPKLEPFEPVTEAPQGSWLRRYWPLFAAGLLFMCISGFTIYASLNPELTAQEGLIFAEPAWEEPATYRYQIHNRAEEPVGEAECRVEPGEDSISLQCTEQVEAYEVQLESSFFSSDTYQREWTTTWDTETLAVQDFSLLHSPADYPGWEARLESGQLVVTQYGSEETDTLDLPESFIMRYEWPWRLMNLEATVGEVRRIPLVKPLRYNEEIQRSAPAADAALVRVLASPDVRVPAGSFQVVEVVVDETHAWYSSETPYPLVRFDDGMHYYELIE